MGLGTILLLKHVSEAVTRDDHCVGQSQSSFRAVPSPLQVWRERVVELCSPPCGNARMACDHEWELPAMPSSVSRCVEVDKIRTASCSDMLEIDRDFIELVRVECRPIEGQAGDLQIERFDGSGVTLDR